MEAVVVVQGGDISKLDPQLSTQVNDITVSFNIFDNLTARDPDLKLNTIALDPTGKFVAAGGLDKTIRIWSLGPKSGALVNSLIAHEDAILRLAYSPDGKFIVSSAADKTIKVFKAGDLTEI